MTNPLPHSDDPKDDSLDRALRSLPSEDVDSRRRERIRRTAHRALDVGPPGPLAVLYRRFFEPTLVTGVAVVVLVWAFQQVALVLLGG